MRPLRMLFPLACIAAAIAASPPRAAANELPRNDSVTAAAPAAVEAPMPIKTFFLTPTESVRVSLRRFSASDVAPCPAAGGWCHDASVIIADSAARADWPTHMGDHPGTIAHHDARWPTTCEKCGAAFQPTDRWQLRMDSLYAAPDGRLFTLADAPIGAMWNAHWMREWAYGPDRLSLVVKTPGGDWMVDGRASNCTMPNDSTHRCWVRHGDPISGAVHVDKNGHTCAAGAGSILIGRYHGFLHNGYLTDC